jgi:23S rRNA (guanosine2251-2'-O)-methyltransferase
MDVLYGLHPVEEALRAGVRRFDHVCVAKERHDARMQRVIDACRAAGVRLRFEPKEHLTRLAQTSAHQGVVAVAREKAVIELEDLLEAAPGSSNSEIEAEKAVSGKAAAAANSGGNGTTSRRARLLLALDGVEDPQNLGALLRTADGAGVDGVVLTERRSAPLSAVALKASAGAAEHLRIARVVNLVRALEQMKAANIWSVGLDERGTVDYDEFDFTGDCVLVLGREGAGLHDLVRKSCDHLLRIPMAGGVSSLNVSAAGAVVLYEAARQRRAQKRSETAQNGGEASPTRSAPARKQKGLGS